MFFPAWHASTDSSVKGIASQLERRRHAVANRWNLDSELVLIGAGDPIPIPGRADRTYPFRSHSEYFYLTDRERPGGVLAFDPHDGWVDFVTEVTRDERLWEGASSAATEGIPISGLEPWLARQRGRRVACLGVPRGDTSCDSQLTSDLRHELNHVRRQKDANEL